MELNSIIQTLWRRSWLVALGVLLAAAAAFVVSSRMEPIYEAKLILAVNQTANTPFSSRSIVIGEDLALTYSNLVKARPVLEAVIDNLGLDLTPAKLQSMLRTDLIPNTQLLELAIQDTDPQRASDIVNEIAATFILLHSLEQQNASIAGMEENLLAQMGSLQTLIEENQAALDKLSASSSASPRASVEGTGDAYDETLPPYEVPTSAQAGGQALLGAAGTPSDPTIEAQTSSLRGALSSELNSFSNLIATYLNLQLTKSQFFDVSVVEPGIPPKNPIRPNVKLYALLAAFLGANAGIALAFLLEHMDRSLKTSDDIRRVLSLPALGFIPRLQGPERRGKLVMLEYPRSASAEAFRALRTNLRFTGVDRPLHVLVVTSAEPGAGKSTVAANLGIACAQAGLRVLLIDTDLRRPQLWHMFAVGNQAGLTNLIVGDIERVDQCILQTETKNLSLLPSGSSPPNPSELLASKRMEAVLADTKRSAELVILDAPPATVVSDAAVLAQKADGVLLVVRAGKTSREMAQTAMERILQAGANPIGAVVNALPMSRQSREQYRYYARKEGALKKSWRRLAGIPSSLARRSASPSRTQDKPNASATPHRLTLWQRLIDRRRLSPSPKADQPLRGHNDESRALIAVDYAYTMGPAKTLKVEAPGVLAHLPTPSAQYSAALASLPANGQVTMEGDGSFIYAPNAGFSGIDSFSYVIRVGESTSDPAIVEVTANEAPSMPRITAGRAREELSVGSPHVSDEPASGLPAKPRGASSQRALALKNRAQGYTAHRAGGEPEGEGTDIPVDFITTLYALADEKMRDVEKHPQAILKPSELVTIGVLFALRGGYFRSFYRWLEHECDLFSNLPDRTRLQRQLAVHRDWLERFLADPAFTAMIRSRGIRLVHSTEQDKRKNQSVVETDLVGEGLSHRALSARNRRN